MVPVGLMWVSDLPRLKLDQPTQEQWINTNRGQKLHLGRKRPCAEWSYRQPERIVYVLPWVCAGSEGEQSDADD
jgi:hypothetical protein